MLKCLLITQFNIFHVPLTLFLCSAGLMSLNIAVNLLLYVLYLCADSAYLDITNALYSLFFLTPAR